MQRSSKTKLIIDPRCPWKLPRLPWNSRKYPYTMSASEWEALLARANADDPDAEWGVADRYEDGCKDKAGRIVVRRSARNAAKWLRLAAEHGCASAQNNWALLLDKGTVVRRNRREALVWLKRAFRGGGITAANNIAIIYREHKKFRNAFQWFEKCVAAEDGDALVQLGIHYYWGKGVRRDPTAGVRCFRKATNAKYISGFGRDDAYFYLGIAYLEGGGVKASTTTARQLLERANVDNDHPAARKALLNLS